MSTPPDILSQILQGGLLSPGSPNALNSGLMGADPSSQVGMQLLANSSTPGKFGSILGKSMLGAQQQQQQNASQQMQLLGQGQDLRMKALQQQMFMQAYPQWIQTLSGQGGGQQGQQGPQAPPGAPPQMGGAPPQAPGMPGPGPQAAPAQGAQPAASQDPFQMLQQGMLGAAMGMPGAQQMIDVAKARLQYDPQLQTKIEAAKDKVSVDQEQISQALKGGNTALAWGLTQKLQQDMGLVHVASMSGTRTTFTPGGVQTVNPNEGMATMDRGNGNITQSLIPGAAGAIGTKAAAEAQGKATGEVVPVTNQNGTTGFAPRSTVTGGSAPGIARSAAPPISTGDPTLDKAIADPTYKLPPLQPGQSLSKSGIKAREDLLDDSQKATDAASQSLQYLKAAQQIMQSKGAPVTGLFGPAAAQISRVWGGVNATNYQEVAKYLGNAALATAKQTYGARMTQSEVKLQLNELSPSTHMTPDATNNLLDTNMRSAQYTVDSARRANAYLKAGNDPQTFAQWNQQYFPRENVVNKPSSGMAPPPGALAYLKAHPETAAQFKAKYGSVPGQ